MKIASLLPAATELVYALGLGDSLIGVTDECDHPADAITKPVLCRSSLPHGRLQMPREIDEAVRTGSGGQAGYVLDRDLLRREQPDVICSQDICRVCAIPSGNVRGALEELGLPDTRVLSMDPQTLDEVISTIEAIGEALDRTERAGELTATMREQIARVKETAKRLPVVSVLALEWSDPPFSAGRWMPDMIEAVGGVPVLAEKGKASRQVAWHEVRVAAPEVVVFMPCGSYLEEAEEEAASFLEHPEFADTPAARNGNVFAVDATSFFSRPGPRIVDGLEILAWAVQPDAYPPPPDGTIAKLR
jgi:iron complex transport system substrate-binding protein